MKISNAEEYEITISMSKEEALEVREYLKLAINKIMGEMQADRDTYSEYEDYYFNYPNVSENTRKSIKDTMDWLTKDYEKMDKEITKIAGIRNAIIELTRKMD